MIYLDRARPVHLLTFGKLEDLQQQIPEKRKAILWTKG